jgi:very-short-patch-repair endonuclease
MSYRNYYRKRNRYGNRQYRNRYGGPLIVYFVDGILLILSKVIYLLIRSVIHLLGWIWGKITGRKEADGYSATLETPFVDVFEADKIAETFKPVLEKSIEVPRPSYSRRPSMLTGAESNFYKVLVEIAKENNYVVQTKVRLEALIRVNFYVKNWFGLRNRIKSREMDFVLCEERDSNLNQILVIELDDSSHLRQDRAKRDENIDAILQEAGLPILHVPVATFYNPNDLLRQIKEKVGT